MSLASTDEITAHLVHLIATATAAYECFERVQMFNSTTGAPEKELITKRREATMAIQLMLRTSKALLEMERKGGGVCESTPTEEPRRTDRQSL